MKKLYLIFFILGVITALPYAFPVLWFVPWLSLIPFAYILISYGSELKKRKAYLLGLSFGMGYFGLTYHWFISFYGMDFLGLESLESVLLVAVCWIGLSLIQALEFGMLPVLYRVARPKISKPWIGAVLISALWMIYEWQQTLFWRGVPWARLALTQSSFGALWQSASLFGSIFVSGLIVLVSSLIGSAVFVFLKKRKTCGKKLFKLPKNCSVICAVAVGLFLINLIFGLVKTALPYKTEGEPFGAAVIQGNISSAEKWNTSAWDAADIYISLTEECVAKARENGMDIQLVVWPETVLKDGIYNSAIKHGVKQCARELNVTVLTGAFEIEYTDDGHKNYNSIYAFYPDGTVDETCYRKQKLVPFGEFTPMETVINTLLPILAELNILSSDPYTPGDDSTVFDGMDGTEAQKIGSLVCFDSIYESLTIDSVRNGAEIITLSTNDSWFSDSAAVYQHNRHACLRAIESGRYFVRAANTGVSSIITPDGEIITEVAPLIEGYTYCEVSRISERTLYSYVGNLVVYLSIAFYVGYVTYSSVKEKILSK